MAWTHILLQSNKLFFIRQIPGFVETTKQAQRLVFALETNIVFVYQEFGDLVAEIQLA